MNMTHSCICSSLFFLLLFVCCFFFFFMLSIHPLLYLIIKCILLYFLQFSRVSLHPWTMTCIFLHITLLQVWLASRCNFSPPNANAYT